MDDCVLTIKKAVDSKGHEDGVPVDRKRGKRQVHGARYCNRVDIIMIFQNKLEVRPPPDFAV